MVAFFSSKKKKKLLTLQKLPSLLNQVVWSGSVKCVEALIVPQSCWSVVQAGVNVWKVKVKILDDLLMF